MHLSSSSTDTSQPSLSRRSSTRSVPQPSSTQARPDPFRNKSHSSAPISHNRNGTSKSSTFSFITLTDQDSAPKRPNPHFRSSPPVHRSTSSPRSTTSTPTSSGTLSNLHGSIGSGMN